MIELSQRAEKALSGFRAEYESRTRRSQELSAHARGYLPGGVSGSAKFFRPYPLYVVESGGQFVTDVDGNRYLDTLYGGGPWILGHSPDAVMDAVAKQMRRCASPLIATELEVELAMTVRRHLPSMEMVRFTVTGAEATLMATRVARAFTGREMIAKFEGHYHGQYDGVLVSAMSESAGDPDRPQPVADCAGIPTHVVDSTVVLPFNNLRATREILTEVAEQVACVIVEPIGGFGLGAIPAERDFLLGLRTLTRELGILLIFDEVVTGFRLGLGGAQAWYGVTPDLTALGKVLGGGFPIGAYGGSASILERVVSPATGPEDRSPRIFHSGTFTGNPVSCAAGLATLAELEKPGVYEHIDRLGARIRDGLEQSCRELALPAQVTGVGSIFNLHFNTHEIRDRRDVLLGDRVAQEAFAMGCLANDIYTPPFHIGFTSLAETDADVDRLLEVAAEVLAHLGPEGH